jgi:hypothetical protein
MSKFRLRSQGRKMMRSALLAVSVVALGGALLFSPVSQRSAHSQMLGALKASADSSNLVTLVRRGGGGGRGGISRGGGGRGGHIARAGGGRAMHAYRGGGRAHVSHPIRRGGYAGNIGRGHWNNGHWNGNRYYGNRYYRGRYGYWPWIGVGAGAYYYGSTNCDWLYRHNYRRWLAVCQ